MEKQRKAVIFDLDGTLLDTLQDLASSVNFALSQYGFAERTVPQIRSFLGNGVRNLMQLSAPEGLENQALEDLVAAFRSHYLVHCFDNTAPYPQVMELLQALRDREIAVAIVSNKVDEAVKALNLRYFQDKIAVAIGERPGVRKKPAPDTVFAALEELGCGLETAVYVGDSEVDLQTAKNAGLACISVSWGFRDETELVADGAQILVRHPLEILSYV